MINNDMGYNGSARNSEPRWYQLYEKLGDSGVRSIKELIKRGKALRERK